MWQHLIEKGIKLPKITSKEIDKKVEPVLRSMEKVGIELDVAVLKDLAEKTEKRIFDLEKEIYKLAGEEFNISSPIQMAEILFQKLKLPTTDIKKTKTGFSTAAPELKKLLKSTNGAPSGNAIIKPILEYRELSKLLSTYLLPLPLLVDKDSRLHTTYGQDTNTGRLTSSNPNLQNIPIKGEWGAEIRKAFVASSGNVLIAADYSQIELRIVACLADDTVMLEAFKNNIDIHSKTAAEIFNVELEKVTPDQRRIAKTVNFGVLYGMSPYGLSQALGISQEDAANYIKRYFEIHSGIRNYCDSMIEFAKKNGYVETLFGFKRELKNINSPMRGIAEAESRMAINSPVQGTAAEIMKLAIIELDKKIKEIGDNNIDMLLTIHDEIVLEVSTENSEKVKKLIKDVMENIISLPVVLNISIGIGENLGEIK